MTPFMREVLVVGVLVVFGAIISGVIVSQFGRSGEPSVAVSPEGGDVGIDGPELTPALTGELRIVTATAGPRVAPTREIASPATPPPVPTATQPAVVVASPVPAVPTTPPAPRPPAQTAAADFSGRWRIIDTVTQGAGTGQSFTFDVSLQQTGNTLSGGNSGLQITGTVSGQTASVTYSQPAIGHTGTFTWTLVTATRGDGTFTSSVPNSGASTLQRLQ